MMAGVRQLLVSAVRFGEHLPRAAFGLHPHSDATSNHTLLTIMSKLVVIDISRRNPRWIHTESETTKPPKKPAITSTDA